MANGRWKIKTKYVSDKPIPSTAKVIATYTYNGKAKEVIVKPSESGWELCPEEWDTEVGKRITPTVTYRVENGGDNKYTITGTPSVVSAVYLSAKTPIDATATTINYKANSDENVTIEFGDITKHEKTGTFSIKENSGDTDIEYVISAYCDGWKNETYTTAKVIQHSIQPQPTPTISITSPSPISSAETKLNYLVTTSPDNTPVIVKYKNYEKTDKNNYFEINPNTSDEPIYHAISAYCSEHTEISASTIVKQEAKYTPPLLTPEIISCDIIVKSDPKVDSVGLNIVEN